MVYLLWRSLVKKYIQENFENTENWESWVIWRDLFLSGKIPEEAASEAYKIAFELKY